MRLFRKKVQDFEVLPDQITANERITCWHSTTDGSLGYLVIDGSAKSAESVQRFWRIVGILIIGCWIAGVALKHALISAKILSAGAGLAGFLGAIALFAALVFWSTQYWREKRVCTVTTDTLTIEQQNGTLQFALNQVVGIQRHAVDQQRVDTERRRLRRQRDPRLMQPFSADLMLETSLGQVALGAVFGLEDARNIADALNTAIQFMKGRTASGAGTVVDPQFQYQRKTAGQIPE